MIDKVILKAFGGTVGPLGFITTDQAAKDLDAALKSLPKDVKQRFKTAVMMPDGDVQEVEGYCRLAVSSKGTFDDGEQADVSFVTTDSLDRDMEVVLPGGLDWKQFKMNPVVTAFHDYKQPPLGKNLWVKREQKGKLDGWLAKTRYTPAPANFKGDWFPSTVYHFVKSGDMPGKSIGFVPLNYRKPTEKEIVAKPEYARAYGVIDKALVLEYAVCTVQSNPDALVQSVAKMVKCGRASASLLLKAAGIEAGEYEYEEQPPVSPDQVKYRVVPDRAAALKELHKRYAGKLPDIIAGSLDRLRGRV